MWLSHSNKKIFGGSVSAAHRQRLFLLSLVFCSPLLVAAQSTEPIETLRIDTDLVNLNVSVFNHDMKRPAAPLSQKDFACSRTARLRRFLFLPQPKRHSIWSCCLICQGQPPTSWT
jgi:hypothetical protein